MKRPPPTLLRIGGARPRHACERSRRRRPDRRTTGERRRHPAGRRQAPARRPADRSRRPRDVAQRRHRRSARCRRVCRLRLPSTLFADSRARRISARPKRPRSGSGLSAGRHRLQSESDRGRRQAHDRRSDRLRFANRAGDNRPHGERADRGAPHLRRSAIITPTIPRSRASPIRPLCWS